MKTLREEVVLIVVELRAAEIRCGVKMRAARVHGRSIEEMRQGAAQAHNQFVADQLQSALDRTQGEGGRE